MRSFLLLAVVGLAAQLVDGSLGMAYGVTSQSLLLVVGLAPALASAAVHISEVGTTAASGASHWRFGNVDWGKVSPLAIPGAIGAFITAVGGVILVTNMKTFLESIGIGGFLAILVYILIVAVWISALVFSIRVNNQEKDKPAKGERQLS